MFGKTHPNLVQYLKSGVPGGGTGSGEWGAELVGIDNRYTGDFVDLPLRHDRVRQARSA
jgi:hypothetical protein